MNLGQSFEQALLWARQRHAWVVPTTLLLVSHLIFAAGGGFITGVVSGGLSYAALLYFAKYSSPHAQV